MNVNNKIESSKYISQFSKLIRISLESAAQNKVSLNNELDRLRLFLSLEKARLDNKFNYSIQVPADLDTEEIKIPNLIIQPFVENAIWHGNLTEIQSGKNCCYHQADW